MNVIFILSDSLRRDHVGCYGAKDIHTPCIDRLAKESAVFDRAYIASYPTVPNRHDLIIGDCTFTDRGWGTLKPGDVTLPGILGEHGVVSQIVFDPPPVHYGNFMRDFSGWWFTRGHHADAYITDPTIRTPLPGAPYKFKNVGKVRQHLRNRSSWQYEKDYMAPKTITKAMEWLERNYTRDKFFLWVDVWDPHEPFDPPIHYLRRYADLKEEVENNIYPCYGRCDYMTEAELKRVRALYAGEVTMVDTWVGQLIDTTERLGIRENTLIILMTDHGHLFGEHNLEGKPGGSLGKLYETTTRIPLIVWHPQGFGSGKRIKEIVQPQDILPTILDFFEVPIPKTVHGSSILPLITEETEAIHKYAFSSRFLASGFHEGLMEAAAQDGWAGPAEAISPVTVTNERWALICSPERSMSELYDLDTDPKQQTNLIDRKPDIAEEMREAFIEFINQMHVKKEWLDPFLLEISKRECLTPERTLHCIRDDRGKIIAFGTKELARASIAPQMSHQDIETISFGSLVDRDPKALIKVHRQFYWAEDLVKKGSRS